MGPVVRGRWLVMRRIRDGRFRSRREEASTMPVSFAQIKVGESYSRQGLAEKWGYAGIQALACGVVTPKDDNKIILFVTHEKQSDAEQYEDELSEGNLHWEGPTDHFAEDRILTTATSG